MATIAKKENSGFTIGVSCPGCGGELELDDNFFAIECNHCGSGHRIVMPDSPPAFVAEVKVSKQEARYAIDRYLKENNKPLTHSDYQLKRMYYPYWKVDAILFRFRKGVEKKVVLSSYEDDKEISYEKEKIDITLSPYTTTLAAGMHYDGLPESLGLRSEYLKLYPLSEDKIEEGFDILPIIKSWENIRKSLSQHTGAIGSFDTNRFGVNHTDISNPKALLLYFPLFLFDFYENENFNRFIVDGVTGRVLNHTQTLETQTTCMSEPVNVNIGEIAIVRHQCHNCGEDLPSEESLIYICQNCQVLTDLEPGVEIETIQQVVHQYNSQDIFIPFWALTMNGPNLAILKSIFGGIYDSDHIVIPAFRVKNYNAIFKLCKRMSAAYPQFKFETITKLGSIYNPVNLPLNEAVSLTDLFIKTDQYKKQSSQKNSPEQFKYDKATLFYAPFHLESYFYVDSVLQAVTFEKQLL